jgi:hypothetical protein
MTTTLNAIMKMGCHWVTAVRCQAWTKRTSWLVQLTVGQSVGQSVSRFPRKTVRYIYPISVSFSLLPCYFSSSPTYINNTIPCCHITSLPRFPPPPHEYTRATIRVWNSFWLEIICLHWVWQQSNECLQSFTSIWVLYDVKWMKFK